jgi:hypothetical protein
MTEPVWVVEQAHLTEGVASLSTPQPSDRADRQAYGSHPEISRMHSVGLESPRPHE